MNIVIICDYAFIKGGDSKVAITSAVALKKESINVFYFAAVGPIDDKLIENGVEVVLTGQSDLLENKNRFSASVQGIWNIKAKNKFSALLEKLDSKETIIHIHSVVKAVSPYIYNIIIARGFKFVTTLHDYFLACPLGSFYDHDNKSICNLKPLGIHCLLRNCDSRNYSHKLWRFARTLIQKNIFQIPSKIKYFITISDLSEAVLKPFLSQDTKLFRLNNPIEIKKQPPVKITEDSPFAFIGRISPEKGVEMLAEISLELERKIIFIGNGPASEKIKEINPSIEITGWLSTSSLLEKYNSLRALIYPSLWYEVQPLVVLEALANGLPVVVPDNTASKELVEDEITGLWFKAGEKTDLVKKLKILNDVNYARKLGEKAYDIYWKNPFTVSIHTSNLMKIYETILAA